MSIIRKVNATLLGTAFVAMCTVFRVTMCFAASDGPEKKPTIAIHISTHANAVLLGSNIKIGIAATNVSESETSLPYDKSGKAELSGFKVLLLDDAASKVKITKYHWELTDRKAPREKIVDPDQEIVIVDSVVPIQMPPGRTVDYSADLKDLYKINVPGTYRIQVEKEDPVNHAIVKSNILTITVKGP